MINERCLRIREVRLIDADGQNIGVLSSREALALAKEKELDLVMISPHATPPVCRIIDYGKHKYVTEKQQKEAKSKKKSHDIKGIKFRPNTSEYDLGHLLKNAAKFVEEGHKLKVICQFRAREIAHPEIGKRKMDYFAAQMGESVVIEKTPSLDGRLMVMILSPKLSRGNSTHGKNETENEQNSSEAV